MSDTPTPFDSPQAPEVLSGGRKPPEAFGADGRSGLGGFTPPAQKSLRYPRVWTVFVATLVALLVHLGASTLILNAAALVALGPDGVKRLAKEEEAFEAEQAKKAEESAEADPPVEEAEGGDGKDAEKPKKERSPFEKWMISFAKTPVGFAIVILPGQLAFLGVTLLFAFLSPQPWRERLAIRWPREHWVLWVMFALSTPATALIVTVPLSQFVSAEDSRTLADFQEIFSSGGVAFFVLTVLGVALMPALAEEFLFRGYVQSRLLRAWPAWGAILVSAILFAVAHMDPIQSLGVLPIGIWMGIVAFRTNSLLPAIGCHLVNNTYALVAMRLASTFASEDPEKIDLTRWEPWAAILVVVSSIFFFAVSGLYLLATGILRELGSSPPPLPDPEPDVRIVEAVPAASEPEGVEFLSDVRPYWTARGEEGDAPYAIPVEEPPTDGDSSRTDPERR
ncbi:MAG TPA: type II CAAX endopeptidase family protein [Pirellulaceae bacterium]|jgi:membrane protease YdiL (CAAX protease family)|nr:type II CAAX endopeptidase family protein [Pirellulaceae bacterium]